MSTRVPVIDDNETLGIDAAPTRRGGGASRTIRVLVVEDQMLLRAGIRAALERIAGVEIVGEAASGSLAPLMLAQCRPDLAVVDLDMPRGEGAVATRSLAAAAAHPAVLVLSDHPESERLVEALSAGASGYLTKDVAQPEFASAVQAIAAGSVYVRPHASRMLAALLSRPVRPAAIDPMRAKFEALSTRERAVLRMVAEGNTGPEVGTALGITAKTVDTYRHRIHEKTGLTHRRDYVRFALAIGLLSAEP